MIKVLILFLFVTGVAARDLTPGEWQVIRKVKKLYEEEKLEEVISLLKPLSEENDPHEAVFSYISSAFIQLRKYREAFDVLKQAVALYPEIYSFQYNRGVTAMYMEEYNAAIEAFQAAREIQEKKGEDASGIIYYMANACYMLEQYDRAIELLKPLLDKDSSVNHQWIQLIVNCYIIKADWVNAEKVLKRRTRIMPEEDLSWQMLGNVFIQQKKYKEAAGAYEIAVLSGNNNITPANMFSIYRFLLIHSEAARWAGNPELKNSHLISRAEQLYMGAHFDEAINLLDGSPETFKIPEAIVLKGKCLLGLDKDDAALKTWLSCMDAPIPETGDQRSARKKRDEICGRAFILAGETCWMQKKWLEARDIFKELSYLPGYENTGKSLADTMQYILENKP